MRSRRLDGPLDARDARGDLGGDVAIQWLFL
jgi:hypothetical protein